MSYSLILGIDPGKSGAIAYCWPGGRIEADPMPADDELRDIIETAAINPDCGCICYLEQVQGFIGKAQPGSSMFKFGDGYGFIRGLLAANRIKTVLVRPQTWQKSVPGITGKGADRKRALRDQAARLFPGLKVTLSTADALLIAEYGRRAEMATATTQTA